MSEKRSKFVGLFQDQENQAEQPAPLTEQPMPSSHTHQEETLEPRNQESKKSRNQEMLPIRESEAYLAGCSSEGVVDIHQDAALMRLTSCRKAWSSICRNC